MTSIQGPDVAFRYRAQQAAVGQLPPLSDTAQAARDCFLRAQQERNRGANRRKNDSTMGTRAAHFRSWLQRLGLTHEHVLAHTDENLPVLLAQYAHDVMQGDNLQNRESLTSDTLVGYITCAALECQLIRQKPVNLMINSSMHPIIADEIHFTRRWKSAAEKREPFT